MSATAPSHTPTVSADPQTTAHATEAINFILAAKDCPSEFRPLIDYLIGASGGSTDWFEAADEEVGYAARPSEGPPSRDAATKYVQRKRKGLLEWEGRAGVAFVECMPGGKDAATGKKYKSRYKLNLLAMAEETVRDAQEMSLWKRDERRALELTAAEKAEATQGTRARKDRFRPPRRDEDALLQRNPKTALTLLKETASILAGREELDPEAFVADFARQLRATLAAVPPCAPNVSTLNTERVDRTGGTGGASPVLRAKCGLCGEFWEVGTGPHACPPPAEKKVDTDVHHRAEAESAVELFESVGAHEFGVTLKHDPSPPGEQKRDYMVLTGDELRGWMPQLFAFNATTQPGDSRPWSVIARPEAERVTFWQVDDHGEETRERLRDVALATIETSPGNYLSFVAITDESEKEELDAARDRFLEAVKRTGGNGGSYGAVRLPGTLNRKHDPAPLVRVVHSNLGRTTTLTELEELGLLAPPTPPGEKAASNVVDFGAASRPWPSYEKALADAPRKANGQPDRSAADFSFAQLSFLRGKTCYEVRAKLLEVSESARTKTEHYLERTLDRAQDAAR